MHAAVFAAVLTVSFAGPPLSLAAPASEVPDPNAEARRRFAQGAKLYSEGDLAGAQFEFERSHALSGNYKILYNLAVVYLERHDYAAAKRALTRYISEGDGAIDPTRLAEVEAELSELNGRVGRLALQIQPSDAEVSWVAIDGDPVDRPEDEVGLELNLGSHTLEVTAPGYLPYSAEIEIHGGLSTTHSVTLEPRRPPAPSLVQPQQTPQVPNLSLIHI